MGNIKKNSLADKVTERQLRKEETVHIENRTIDNIISNPKGKDKAISARVNGTTYENFRRICDKRGITSNACLNMLITDFVRENKNILE